MKKVIVVIPVYKPVENLEHFEKISIKNTIDKFHNFYSIALLNSDKILKKSYVDYFKFNFLSLEFHFSTWAEYNSLLKKSDLYDKIGEYEFMLIIQTDAYVFSNDLNKYFQYDYVGAPWQRDPLRFTKGSVGNGGFSLRSINPIRNILISNKRIFNFRTLLHLNFKHFYKYGPLRRVNGFKRFTLFQIIEIFVKSIYQYLFLNSFRKAHLFDSLMEDTLFGVLSPHRFSSFKVPNVEISSQFSIDDNPEYFFKLNASRLPIGCHAFIKNYSDFWIKFIKV